MGDGWLGFLCNCTCITWTLFVCVIFSIPTNLPVTKLNMNYASVSSCRQTISLIFYAIFQGNCYRSYCLRLVSLALIIWSTSMLIAIGVVYGTSGLLTSTMPDLNQTFTMIQSPRSIKIFKPKNENFVVPDAKEYHLLVILAIVQKLYRIFMSSKTSYQNPNRIRSTSVTITSPRVSPVWTWWLHVA